MGYQIDSGQAWFFRRHRGSATATWKAVNKVRNLKHLIVECAFSSQNGLPSSPATCAEHAGNRTAETRTPVRNPTSHPSKPGQIELTMKIEDCLGSFGPRCCRTTRIFEF